VHETRSVEEVEISWVLKRTGSVESEEGVKSCRIPHRHPVKVHSKSTHFRNIINSKQKKTEDRGISKNKIYLQSGNRWSGRSSLA
jgi:hypothetical protein